MQLDVLCKDDVSAWFAFGGDSEVRLRYLGTEEADRLASQSISDVWEGGRTVRRRDNMRFLQLLADAVIMDWRGFTLNGAEYPYSADNARWLVRQWFEFAAFVNTSSTALSGFMERRLKEAEKNS